MIMMMMIGNYSQLCCGNFRINHCCTKRAARTGMYHALTEVLAEAYTQSAYRLRTAREVFLRPEPPYSSGSVCEGMLMLPQRRRGDHKCNSQSMQYARLGGQWRFKQIEDPRGAPPTMR
ncbi:unnamed protein product, partial [Iphiclides podalirius]